MNSVPALLNNPSVAARTVRKILTWYPNAAPDPEWTKDALDMLKPYGDDILARLLPIAQRRWTFGFPSIPDLRQALDATLQQAPASAQPLRRPDEASAEARADAAVRANPDAIAQGWWYGIWSSVYADPKKAESIASCQRGYYATNQSIKNALGRIAKGTPQAGDETLAKFASGRAERRAAVAQRLGIPEHGQQQVPPAAPVGQSADAESDAF